MQNMIFDRNEHIYASTAFAELVKDAVRFFNGTPVHTLPPPEFFGGTGVYAIYYTGQHPAYQKYAGLNRLAYNCLIYVGKAVPKGWRQARLSDDALNRTSRRNCTPACVNILAVLLQQAVWQLRISCAVS